MEGIIPLSVPNFEGNESKYVNDALSQGWVSTGGAYITELEKKLADYEDKWYAKFAAMETALAKMQNNASAVTSLLGG